MPKTFLLGLLPIFAIVTGCLNSFSHNRAQSLDQSRIDQSESANETQRPSISGLQDVDQDDYHPAMLDPKLANKTAPDNFKVKFETTKGDFIMEIHRDWAPNGVDRFYNLVDIGYFKNIAIFRAVPRFMFQFGIHGDPQVNAVWKDANIKDDPYARKSNQPGAICFAHAGPNTRSTQMFINLGNNSRLDRDFPPFGEVIEGMDVVRKINTEYGENPGDVQPKFQTGGNKFILDRFPNIDIIKSVTLIED